MDSFLFVSNIILWVAVMVLSVTVYALLRQVGVLYERIAPAGALMIQNALSVGDPAPEQTHAALMDNASIVVGGNTLSKSQLLFFIAADCPVCKTLLPALSSVQTAEGSWLDIILTGDDDDFTQRKLIADYELQSFPFINSAQLGRAFGVAKLPYGVLIDEEGAIRASGLINSREHMESLFEAKERSVASIQEYLTKKDNNLSQEIGNEMVG